MAPPPPTPSSAAAAGAPPPQSTTASSPPPSTTTQRARTRTLSNATMTPSTKRTSTTGGGGGATPQLSTPKVHYTVLVRLPFARGDFVDPAQVEWDATKDQALWKIISRPMSGGGGPGSERREINWQELATRFEVGQGFILQQAAWLYERHLQHVRAQMRKVGGGAAAAAGAGTAGSGSGNVGGVPMKRGGSNGGAGGASAAQRTVSALSIRSRDSPVPGRPAVGSPVVGGQLSRTPSTTTITQSRLQLQPQSPRQPLRSSFRSSFPPAPRRASPTLEPTAEASRNQSRTVSPTSMQMSQSESESSSSDDDKDNPIRRSQLFKRPPRFMSRPSKPGLPRLDDVDIEYDDTIDYGNRAGDERSEGDDDDDDDDEFLPFAVPTRRRTAPNTRQPQHQGAHAGPRRSHTHHHQQRPVEHVSNRHATADSPRASRPPMSAVAAGKQPVRAATMDSSFTSASDARSTDGDDGTGGNRQRAGSGSPAIQGAFAGRRQKRRAGTVTAPYSPSGGPATGALSPRHRAELARLSPGMKREGSEGTPSMGSSFSDLDDASVTQSALEEQLLSHMQHQGGLSKMSTISQALRSRYLP
ncbi:Autophagy-related protein 29 [Lasiodiplodia theobromae]|uniref:Autophagy-related protein 29 n=1 Tax=Lasiodiplodia theobromae TaxID=45133 RepID=A0A5N5DTX4_9PEZI|nr:Autophagy-related protein 29 [Lasiodiplodia theobromae]